MNIYDIRKYGTALFLAISVGVVAFFLYVSNNLVEDLAAQERERMQIWADATKQLADINSMPGTDAQAENIDFLFSIIQRQRAR